MKYLFLALVLVLNVFNFVACSGKKIDESDPQALYKDAEEDVQSKRYVAALDKLKSIKNKFPYSNVSTQAKLRIADVYFLEESYVEAAASYEAFRDLHPKNEKADYVLFRIGESYFNQLPGGEDRDLTPAKKAIEAYRDLVNTHPKSEYTQKGKEHLKECNEKLAAKEIYVADFYYKRDMYDSAASRYEKVTSEYAGSSFDEYAYYRLGRSLREQTKDDEAKHIYRVYLSRYPSGKYAGTIGDYLESQEKKNDRN